LPGQCGTNDMADIMHCIRAVTENAYTRTATRAPLVDPNRISIVGGSHGGFLSGHAVGQYPQVFKAAVLRNPVTNIAAMVSVSDIPDWCHVEAKGLGSYDFSKHEPPTAADLAMMRSVSPIAHVHNISSPTLIILGQMDLRVPYSQGIEFYHVLKTLQVCKHTKCLVFPKDVHKIDRPKSEQVQWVETAKWLHTHVVSAIKDAVTVVEAL
jgi:acylaminoacyl-peptidase